VSHDPDTAEGDLGCPDTPEGGLRRHRGEALADVPTVVVTVSDTRSLDDDTGGNRLAAYVADAQLVEGDNATRKAGFIVHLSRPHSQPLTFDYTTSDGTATAGQDYTALSGQLAFNPGGSLTRQIAVNVSGDVTLEPTESFNLVLGPVAQLASGVDGLVAKATIFDDDADDLLPVLSILDSRIVEGNSNSDRFLEFTVALSQTAVNDVRVDFQTLAGTAEEVGDFDREFETGSLVVAAGKQTGTFFVRDPSGNAIEMKTFGDPDKLFATE